ncbi:MAG: hypothetical protein ABH850_03045 [Candidatus Micrarchaeota archaeon]
MVKRVFLGRDELRGRIKAHFKSVLSREPYTADTFNLLTYEGIEDSVLRERKNDREQAKLFQEVIDQMESDHEIVKNKRSIEFYSLKGYQIDLGKEDATMKLIIASWIVTMFFLQYVNPIYRIINIETGTELVAFVIIYVLLKFVLSVSLAGYYWAKTKKIEKFQNKLVVSISAIFYFVIIGILFFYNQDLLIVVAPLGAVLVSLIGKLTE